MLAFFGISAFAVLGAALGHYAFQQVGGRIERIDARVPQVVSSMEISRAVDRLIASAPVLLGVSTSKGRDEALKSMRPELDRLIISLNELARGGTVSDAAATIQTLVGALRSNLVELGELVDSRIKTKVRLAELLQALLQIGKDADRMPIDPEAEEVQQLKSAAMPLLFQLREDQKSEVRALARIIGLEKVAAMI